MLRKKILVIAPNCWSYQELQKRSDLYDFVFVEDRIQKEKVSLIDKIRVLWLLNFDRGVRRGIQLAKKHQVDGVLGADDFISCLYASAISKALGFCGTDTQLDLKFHHKYYSRLLQAQHVPEAVPKFGVLHYDAPPVFPVFAKPIRASGSVMARRLQSHQEMKDYFNLPFLKRLVYFRLLGIFSRIARKWAGLPIIHSPAIYEDILEGQQVTLEGYVYQGQHQIVGISDSFMYPHSRVSFSRFNFPSRLPEEVQEKMRKLTRKLIQGSGYSFGFYNIEFFYNPGNQELKIIELNPRMAYQFTDLYEKVLGYNTFDLLLKMVTGCPLPELPTCGKYKESASFVLRVFEDGFVESVPGAARIREVEDQFPDVRVMMQVKAGSYLSSDIFQDLESFVLMTVNIGGQTSAELQQKFQQITELLPFKIRALKDGQEYLAVTGGLAHGFN